MHFGNVFSVSSTLAVVLYDIMNHLFANVLCCLKVLFHPAVWRITVSDTHLVTSTNINFLAEQNVFNLFVCSDMYSTVESFMLLYVYRM